jgi:hypothetical protein
VSSTEDRPQVCNPCREDHHLECDHTTEKPCACLVCLGQEIGDAVVGDWSFGSKRKRTRV